MNVEWDSYDYLVRDVDVFPRPHVRAVGEDEGEHETVPEMMQKARIKKLKEDPMYLQFDNIEGIEEIIDGKFEKIDIELKKLEQQFRGQDSEGEEDIDIYGSVLASSRMTNYDDNKE